jgi:hypothetical protein
VAPTSVRPRQDWQLEGRHLPEQLKPVDDLVLREMHRSLAAEILDRERGNSRSADGRTP